MRRGPRRTLGVVPCRGWSSGRGWAGWRGTTAVARALVPLRGPLICSRTCRTHRVEGCRVGADRASDRASSFKGRAPGTAQCSVSAIPLYPGFAHVCWTNSSERYGGPG
ncbi:hypothetical protein SSIG_07997 [Streptomyces filamentosus NRRL 11379]|nr:hypothetical protein SSIG_07997 [Streptomyces filamentosus NRRL 11379]